MTLLRGTNYTFILFVINFHLVREYDLLCGLTSPPARPPACLQIKWIDRGPDRDEPLVSISTDGRVTQWSITKVGVNWGESVDQGARRRWTN